jgi:hypothetical protein
MRAITRQIATAFQSGQEKKIDNTRSDGEAIYLFGNKIVERREDGGVYVTLSSYGFSRTTAERLAPFCQVYTRRGQTFLNGQPWTGEWKRVA